MESEEGMIFSLNSNGSDCVVDGEIPTNFVSELRSNFKLHVDEKILMFRDTSFWNSQDQGSVVTDWGVTIIPDNDKPDELIQIPWEDIYQVEQRGDQLIFFFSEDRNDCSPIHLSFFIKGEDEYEDAGETLSNLFTQMAASQVKISQSDAVEYALAKYEELYDADNKTEALQVLLQYRDDFNTAIITDRIAFHLAGEKEFTRALDILNEDIDALSEDSKKAKTLLTWVKVSILLQQEYNRLLSLDSSGEASKKFKENNGDYVLAKHRALNYYISKNAPDDLLFESSSNTINIKADAATDFGYGERYLQEHLLELPYKDRKLIVPVEEYTTLGQKTLTAINIDRLGKIDFPMGHPVANNLYVGHPLIPSKYIPFEHYELELIEDRVREFCILAQALGATSITIECVNSTNNKGSLHTKRNVKGTVDYGLSSVSGSMKDTSSSQFLSDVAKKINLHQEFTPKEQPYIPSGLVWFESEPSWQRLAEQRMNGTLNVHNERIETRKSQVVENSELQKIAAEVEVLIVAANGSWEESMNEAFEAHENAILAIHVEFAPIENLTNMKLGSTSNTQPALTENEREYLDELKDCIVNDGEISAGERRLLNKFRVKLGISEDRAMELEASLIKPKLILTDDEREYLTEYKTALEDGELTSLSRRLLMKLRSSMGITEKRAKEIEDSIK